MSVKYSQKKKTLPQFRIILGLILAVTSVDVEIYYKSKDIYEYIYELLHL